MTRYVILLSLLAATGAAEAQNSPADILRGLDQAPNRAAPSTGPDRSGPAPATPKFATQGYRRHDIMGGLFLRDFSRITAASRDVKFYIQHLVGTANRTCPNIDQRIPNAILKAEFGPALQSREAMAEKGAQVLLNLLQQMANPQAMMLGAMDDEVWAGDARADMTMFLQRHGCGEEIDGLLRNAVAYYQNPPAVRPPRASPDAPAAQPRAPALTPAARAQRFLADYVEPRIKAALAAMPEAERPPASASFASFRRELEGVLLDFENVQVTPEKVEKSMRAIYRPELVEHYVRKVAELRGGGLSNPDEIAARAFLAMRDRADGRRSPSPYSPSLGLEYSVREWVYNLEFPMSAEERAKLTPEQRNNRSFTRLRFLLSSGVPYALKLPWHGTAREQIIAGVAAR